MHDYIIPEVLEAYLHGNKKQLKEWCSEAVDFEFFLIFFFFVIVIVIIIIILLRLILF